MEIQQAIKNNADDLQTFLRELKSWEKDMKRKEELLIESSDPPHSQDLPPIRNKVSKMEGGEGSNEQFLLNQQKREQSLFEKERGNEFVKQGKWTQAIYHYTEAINSYSWDATFYGNRALCFLKLEKWKEAETDCTTALQIDTTYEKAYFRRALALKELNQLKEAKADLLEVLRLDPNSKTALSEIAKLAKKMPETKSCELKVELPKDKKQRAYLKKEKGNSFVKLRDWKSAIECYTEACSLYPEEASFYLNRALCFLKTCEPQKAIVDCCRVVELDPDNVKAYYRRAQAHQILNNFSKAHDDLLAALRIDPSDEDVAKFLNTIESHLGILPENTTEEEASPMEEDTDRILEAESNENPKRITGERFTKLGGYFLKPERKAAHMLSKVKLLLKPLRKMKIVDKDDTSESIRRITLNDSNTADRVPHDSSMEARLNGLGGRKANVIFSNSEERNVNVDDLPIPKTTIQFISTWDKLNNDPGKQFSLLKRIGGSNIPSIFKDALESTTFSDILDVLSTYATQFHESVFEFLDGLSRVRRFKALLLFSSSDDTANIEQLLKHCEEYENLSKEKLNELKSRYHC